MADVLGVTQSRAPVLLCVVAAHCLVLEKRCRLEYGGQAAKQLVCRAQKSERQEEERRESLGRCGSEFGCRAACHTCETTRGRG